MQDRARAQQALEALGGGAGDHSQAGGIPQGEDPHQASRIVGLRQQLAFKQQELQVGAYDQVVVDKLIGSPKHELQCNTQRCVMQLDL